MSRSCPISQTVFMLSIVSNRAEHVCAPVVITHNFILMCNPVRQTRENSGGGGVAEVINIDVTTWVNF